MAASPKFASARRAGPRSPGSFRRSCSVEASDPNYANSLGFCHGVLTGAFRYYEATVKTEDKFVCAPKQIPTRAKVMDEFVVWARSHSASLKEPPLDALFRYLVETYPCKS